MWFSLYFSFLAMASLANARYVMYLTGQHYVVPEPALVSQITHVALAFMQPSTFNEVEPSAFPLFTTVEKVRSQFAKGTSIMVAIGGWGDTAGFSKAAETEESRKLFSRNVKAMVDFTGADGVDIDWEYPGGNGEDYKTTPNALKSWEIKAYPLLLSEIRSALGSSKLISAAVPGLCRDMLAFGPTTLPSINTSLDFLNIMAYDLMNRRDNITKHHTGISLSLDAVNAYLEAGLEPEKANLGFAFYLKWFRTDPKGGCNQNPVGCKTVLMEDPKTGVDLGQAGSFSWHDDVPSELAPSFSKALKGGRFDEVQGGHYFWDEKENIWWTWDTEDVILRKFEEVVREKGMGGVFAWGLGEDAPEWRQLRTLNEGVDKWMGKGREKPGSTLHDFVRNEL